MNLAIKVFSSQFASYLISTAVAEEDNNGVKELVNQWLVSISTILKCVPLKFSASPHLLMEHT